MIQTTQFDWNLCCMRVRFGWRDGCSPRRTHAHTHALSLSLIISLPPSHFSFSFLFSMCLIAHNMQGAGDKALVHSALSGSLICSFVHAGSHLFIHSPIGARSQVSCPRGDKAWLQPENGKDGQQVTCVRAKGEAGRRPSASVLTLLRL